jgi:hypothetical protein
MIGADHRLDDQTGQTHTAAMSGTALVQDGRPVPQKCRPLWVSPQTCGIRCRGCGAGAATISRDVEARPPNSLFFRLVSELPRN